MYRYADPTACPGCRSPISRTTTFCTTCGVTLRGPVPQQIFDTLTQVDRLVTQLYAARPAATVAAPVAAPAPAVAPTLAPALTPAGPVSQAPITAPPFVPPPPHLPPPPAWQSSLPHTGLSSASVPKILLGLGALCLLVASLVFLAVAWAALGVDGRTGVLIGFTVAVAALTRWVAGRDLRAGAEAFATVTLGLLAIDLGGAREAGWLGAIDDAWFLVVAGTAVAVVATAAARWAATTPVARLTSAEVVAGLGVLVAAVGTSLTIEGSDAVDVLLAIGVCALGAFAGHRLGLRILAIACGVEAAAFWLLLTGIAVVRLDEPTVAHVWGDLAVWPTLAAAALVAACAVPRSLPVAVRVTAASTGALLATLALTVVSFDESATTVALVELAVVAAYALLAARLPRPWGWVSAVPSAIAAVGLAVSVLLLTVTSLVALLANDPWTLQPLTTLDHRDIAWTWPLLLPAGALGVALAASTLVRCAGGRPGLLVVPGAVAAVVGVALMPALYGVPLAVAVLVLLLATAVLLAATRRVGWPVPAAAAAGTALLALGAALASDWLTATVLALYTAAAVAAEVRGRGAVRVLGRALAPLTGAGLIWTVAHLAELELEWRALPVLLVLGAAIVLRPAIEREVATAVAGSAAVLASVTELAGIDAQWLAAYLALASVIATLSSKVNRDREPLAWAGLALLLPATAAAAVDTWTTCGVLVVFTLTTLVHELRGSEALRTVARAGTPLVGSALIWTVAELADLDTVWRALPILLVLGAAVLVRPVLEREVACATAGAVAVLASVTGPTGVDGQWLAVYATIAAVVTTVSSLVHAERRPLAWPGLALFALASVSAIGHPWTLVAVLALFTGVAVLHELRDDEPLRAAGRALAPLSAAGLLWTIGELVDLDLEWRALPVVLLLGLAVVARPAVEREVASAVAAAAAVVASVAHGPAVDQSWLAVYLTLAGVVTTGSSLLHPTRRRLAWVGLACFTLAQWIRLQQIGVGTVEAYTLPLAVVLLVVGTVALLRGERSSMQTLAPGLGLALVPTLLQVMVDPVSLRAVLLGLGCVALVALGLVRGWAAPLLFGAGAGALVVLRQGTMAHVLPQWMIIGLVGVALTIVGVTWEQRMAEFRRASDYVRRLR